MTCLAEAISIASTIEEDEAQKQKRWSFRRNNWDKAFSTTRKLPLDPTTKA